ncbi:MAG: hypothetical protein ABI851_15495 [Saprospiraceae bacterium]
MKFLFNSLLNLGFSVMLHSQAHTDSTYCFSTTADSNAKNPYLLIISQFDFRNNITEEYFYKIKSVDSIPEQSERRILKYDVRNNEIESLNQEWFDNNWKNKFQSISRFDTKGNQIKYINKEWKKNKWITISQTRSNYFKNNKLHNNISKWNINEEKGKHKSEYVYDESDRIVEQIFYNKNKHHWKPTSKRKFEYNKNNRIIEELEQEYFNGKWTNKFKLITEYSATHKIIGQKNYSWEGNSWINSLMTHVQYNAVDSTLEWTSQFSKNNVLTNKNKKQFIYNEKNQLIEQVDFEWINDNWVIQNKSIFEYNHQSKLIVKEFINYRITDGKKSILYTSKEYRSSLKN